MGRLGRSLTTWRNRRSLACQSECSFCQKRQVRKLIAGPGVYICDECIELCVEMIEDERQAESGRN